MRVMCLRRSLKAGSMTFDFMVIIDYNRQSLDGVVNDQLFQKIQSFFDTVGWNVVTLKYGKKLEAARNGPAGEALLQWIDDCPNDLYSALTYKAGAAWRKHLKEGLRGTSGLLTLLDAHDDDSLHDLMTNLAGHDMETVLSFLPHRLNSALVLWPIQLRDINCPSLAIKIITQAS